MTDGALSPIAQVQMCWVILCVRVRREPCPCCDTQREVELLASSWAETRLQTVIDELDASAHSLLELDQKGAVDELAQRAVEYAPERPGLAVTGRLPASIYRDESQSEVVQGDSSPRQLTEKDL